MVGWIEGDGMAKWVDWIEGDGMADWVGWIDGDGRLAGRAGPKLDPGMEAFFKINFVTDWLNPSP